jgi:hypothetical protein
MAGEKLRLNVRSTQRNDFSNTIIEEHAESAEKMVKNAGLRPKNLPF